MGKIVMAQKPGGGEFELLPQGTYNFEVASVEEGTSKNDNPQLVVKMRVLDGPWADKQFTQWLTLTPKAVWRAREFVEACGVAVTVSDQDAEGNDLIEFDSDELPGRYVTMKVRQEKYEGKMNNKFDKPEAYVAAGPSTPSPRAGGAPASTGTAPGKPGGYPGGSAKPPQGAQPPAQRLPRTNQNG